MNRNDFWPFSKKSDCKKRFFSSATFWSFSTPKVVPIRGCHVLCDNLRQTFSKINTKVPSSKNNVEFTHLTRVNIHLIPNEDECDQTQVLLTQQMSWSSPDKWSLRRTLVSDSFCFRRNPTYSDAGTKFVRAFQTWNTGSYRSLVFPCPNQRSPFQIRYLQFT